MQLPFSEGNGSHFDYTSSTAPDIDKCRTLREMKHMLLGVDGLNYFCFEGRNHTYGHAVWPIPVITQACITAPGGNIDLRDPLALDQFQLVFREDAFDPVTRVRRGRFYKRVGKQSWHTGPHPAWSEHRSLNKDGQIARSLDTFSGERFSDAEIRAFKVSQSVVVLGAKDSYSLWSIVAAETILSGEQLFTLRARTTFGALPELIPEAIPESERAAIFGRYETLADSIHRSGTAAIIDLCREAAVAVIGGKVREADKNVSGLDLGAITDALEKHFPKSFENLKSSARIIARLHARTKTAEGEKRSIRPIVPQDADHAVYCLGAILCDLGWGAWT